MLVSSMCVVADAPTILYQNWCSDDDEEGY